jgi:glyoxylase-like metal-dependent hydrolase (beta-lactamase superfamily II)
MKRPIVLGTLVTVGILTLATIAAQQPAPSVDNIAVEKVKDNLFVLRGGGGNTAVFVTTAGVTLVDTKEAGWGQPLLDKVKTLTPKPVTTVINTHTHYDHVSGNVSLPTTVDIVTHENTKTLMSQWNDITGNGPVENVFKDKPGVGMPKRTFKDKMTIGTGADQVDLYHFGPAHTGGDAFVVFRTHRIMHVGDTFPNKGLPIMDKNNGGVGTEYPNTLTKAAGVPNIDWIINGHTPAQTTPAEMREYADFVREFVTTVQAGKKAGKTLEEVVKAWATPAKYNGYPAANEARVRANATVIWNETK